MTQPVFLLSLQRSGSTLLHRLLATHSQIAATGETWLLLPHLYATRLDGVYAEYGHARAVQGLRDFSAQLPGGIEDYRAALRGLVTGLFEKAAQGKRYFLEKTPLYAYVAPELCELFPDAKLIFMWRNPLAIVASIINSWGTAGKWNVYSSERDLTVGLRRLADAYVDHRDRAHALRFEDLVGDPETELKRVLEYLELQYEEELLEKFPGTHFSGNYAGDSLGIRAYSGVSREPLDKWRATLTGPLRRRWCANYLRRIGQERLAVMGYDLDALLRQLASVPPAFDDVVSDAVRMTYGRLWQAAERNLLRKRGQRRWLLDGLADRLKKRQMGVGGLPPSLDA
ncbi:MAG: sulfotransferase family protein [Acidimicrobiia bacterium]